MKINYKKAIIGLILLSVFVSIYLYKNRSIETSYTSKYQNFTLKFPPDWHGKYNVHETEDSIIISLGFFNDIDLFTITTNLNDTLDSIPHVNKISNINGKDYMIGGPTGVPYSSFTSSKTKKLYEKLRNEIHTVVSSIS